MRYVILNGYYDMDSLMKHFYFCILIDNFWVYAHVSGEEKNENYSYKVPNLSIGH